MMKFSPCFLPIILFLIILCGACGENVDSFTDPDRITIVTGIEIDPVEASGTSALVVPEYKTIELNIVQIYNSGIREPMSVEEINRHINWHIDSHDEISVETVEETGAVKLLGVGIAELTAVFPPSSKNAYQQLISNPVSITSVEAEMTGLRVEPASAAIVGCQFSNPSWTELAEGCLMQFKAVASYDNGQESDVTNAVAWTSEDPGKADFLNQIDFSAIEHKDWYTTRRDYIDQNQLGSKKGLAIGHSIGGFRVSADIWQQTHYSDTSQTVTVTTPELYALETHIAMPEGQVCRDHCTLFQNTSIQIEANGTYTNSIQANVIRQASISSSISDHPAIRIVQLENQICTGEVEIDYDAPDTITFIITAHGIKSEIQAAIEQEEIGEITQLSPPGVLEGPLSRPSNTGIYFLLDATYSNQGFTILDTDSRRETLNRSIFHDWHFTDNSPIVLTNGPHWVSGHGYSVSTSSEDSGTATLNARSDTRTLNWQITIDNHSTKPTSLSINPGYAGDDGDEIDILAGQPLQFSALVTFDNQTSKPVENVSWSTDPTLCQLDMMESNEVACVSTAGLLTTYNPLQLTATTVEFGPDNNIASSLTVNITNTELKGITILPGDKSIYGKDSIQLTAMGEFDNGTTQVLPENCVSWRATGDVPIGITGIYTAADVSGDQSITVTAEAIDDCGGLNPPGRTIPDWISGSTQLTVYPLPGMTLSANPASVNEDAVTQIQVDFSVSAPINRTIIVPFKMSGTADATDDYSFNAAVIEIPPSTPTVTRHLSIVDDELDEALESIEITLLAEGLINGRLAEDFGVSIDINDNDDSPELLLSSVPEVSATEGEVLRFNFVLSEISGRDIPLDFSISGQLTPDDYSFPDDPGDAFIIPAGADSVLLDLNLTDGGQKEYDESLTMDVTADGVSNPQTSTSVTIEDNDWLDISSGLYQDNHECQVNQSCIVSLESYINADREEIPYQLYLYNQPDWVELSPDPWQLLFDAPGSPVEVDDLLLCAEIDNESDCERFSLNIIP